MAVIAVVGGGVAGDEAAVTAKKEAPGDRVILITEEPHPLYSACVLADYVCNEIAKNRVYLRGIDEYRQLGIESMTETRVVGWSPERRQLQIPSGEISYDRLILATGSRSFIPPIPGANKEGVLSLKTLEDADRIRATKGTSAVVVGSGAVGIEAALALRELGWEVTVVELMDRVLPRMFDAPIAKMAAAHLERAGVQVLVGEKVLEILGDERVQGIRTDRRTIDAQLAVMVVGMRPEVTLAKAGGVELGPSGGIRVDQHLATNLPGVWACGDCVESEDRLTGKRGLYMLWNNARVQGRVAGSNAAGKDGTYTGSLNVTTVNFEGQAAASVGYLAADLPANEVEVIHRNGHDGAVTLVIRKNRLVGAQVIGRTERLGGLMGLIMKGGDLRETLSNPHSPQERKLGWHLRGLEKELAEVL
jgi:NADH oxidase (H2O2-forming)